MAFSVVRWRKAQNYSYLMFIKALDNNYIPACGRTMLKQCSSLRVNFLFCLKFRYHSRAYIVIDPFDEFSISSSYDTQTPELMAYYLYLTSTGSIPIFQQKYQFSRNFTSLHAKVVLVLLTMLGRTLKFGYSNQLRHHFFFHLSFDVTLLCAWTFALLAWL